MPPHSRLAIFLRVAVLPLGLIAATVAGLGSYYEASDDTSLAWLFSGILALKPVPSLPLYFHGYGHLLAAAYAAVPGVAWFGLLLGTLLAGATVLTFAVLDRLLRPHLQPHVLALVLVMFFGVAWLEHWLWFSYVRVALLLAGAAVLFAAQRPGQRWALALGLLGLGAAWLMRPSQAVLGLAAALSGAVWLAGGWRRAAPLLLGAVAGLAIAAAVLASLQTPAEAHTQARDKYFARILDFDQLRPQPLTTADSLGTAAVHQWLLGDSTVVNEALCQRAYRFDARDFLLREVPAKLRLRAGLLVRDYFPLLLLLALMALAVGRSARGAGQFWLVQLGFGGALMVFAGLLKLPPRLELPILDFWLLADAAFLLGRPGVAAEENRPAFFANPKRRLWVAGLGVAALVLYGLKTLHRRQVLSAERMRHEQALRTIETVEKGPCVMAGTNDLLKSLSPFRPYGAGLRPVLMLTGWPSHDASQNQLREALSRTTDQTECLRRLALFANAVPQWVLSSEAARWLSRRSALGGGAQLRFTPVAGLAADSALFIYDVRLALPGPQKPRF